MRVRLPGLDLVVSVELVAYLVNCDVDVLFLSSNAENTSPRRSRCSFRR